MATDSITRVGWVLRGLRTRGPRSTADGFVSLLERIRDDWRPFVAADPASWTCLS